MEKLSEKIPSRQEATPVFAVIVFVVFSWTLYRIFWYIPSWLEYLNIWSVVITAAYALSFALLESCVIFALLCFFSLVFPRKTLKSQFVVQASSIVAILTVGAFLLQRKIKLIYRLTYLELLVYPVLILIAILIPIFFLSCIFQRFEFLSRFVRAIAERMTIFLYVYVPLGLLGWLIVLMRNVF
jgi:hypothetical protein